MWKKLVIIIVILALFIFTGYKILAQEPITDADISYHSYTVLTDMEDALINSMRVNYHYEWNTAYQGDGVEVVMSATVK